MRACGIRRPDHIIVGVTTVKDVSANPLAAGFQTNVHEPKSRLFEGDKHIIVLGIRGDPNVGAEGNGPGAFRVEMLQPDAEVAEPLFPHVYGFNLEVQLFQ
jgi:hypothetical protein